MRCMKCRVMYDMCAYVMMYVHEMLSGYARVWENKSLIIAGELRIFYREEMLENNSAGTKLWGKRYSVSRPTDLDEQI